MQRTLPIAVLLLLCAAFTANGQRRVSVAFWNVESLHDTIPSRFYDDGDFTPAGKYRWDTERYNRKLENISRVIGDMGADLAVLAEVENEGVVRDLVMMLEDDYNYIHRTSGDRRGMDLALLYKGDKFYPEKVRLIPSASTREFLHVTGELLGEPVSILACHLPSAANKKGYRRQAMEALAGTADSLMKAEPGRKLILAGDFNSDPSERIFRNAFGIRNGSFFTRSMLYGAIPEPARGGYGSYAREGRWSLPDNILLSFGFIYGEGLRYESGGVFVRGYMLEPSSRASTGGGRAGYPLRTVTSGTYTGGFSDHLPVFVILGD